MTDKTKPWASADHPEVIACKAAGEELYIELGKQGVNLRGFGVGVTDDNQNTTIHVYTYSRADADRVPATHVGYQVKTIVTGDIVAL